MTDVHVERATRKIALWKWNENVSKWKWNLVNHREVFNIQTYVCVCAPPIGVNLKKKSTIVDPLSILQSTHQLGVSMRAYPYAYWLLSIKFQNQIAWIHYSERIFFSLTHCQKWSKTVNYITCLFKQKTTNNVFRQKIRADGLVMGSEWNKK